jgi:hypothetical protein
VKLTSYVTPSIGWTFVILSPVISPLSSKSFCPNTIPRAFDKLILRGFVVIKIPDNVVNSFYICNR